MVMVAIFSALVSREALEDSAEKCEPAEVKSSDGFLLNPEQRFHKRVENDMLLSAEVPELPTGCSIQPDAERL